MFPKLPAVVLLATSVAFAIAATSSSASTSSAVVAATVPSNTQLSNQCTSAAARTFGTVTVSTSNLTTTGAGVCRFQFGSNNAIATARLSQRDGTGSAMAMTDGTGTSSRPRDPSWNAVDVVSATVTFAGRGDGQISRTANDGSSWQVENSGVALPIVGISAIDGTNAYAVGSCAFSCPFIIKRTTAGGVNWTSQTLPGGFVSPLTDVAHLPGTPNTAVAVGASGAILRTTDGGTTWNQVASGTAVMLRRVAFFSSTLAFAAGDSGTLLRSVDAGATWTTITTPVPDAIMDVAIAPGPTLFYITPDHLFRSTNPAAATPTIADIGGPAGTCSLVTLSAPAAATVFMGGNWACSIQRSTDALNATPTYSGAAFASVGSMKSIDADTATHAMAAIDTGALDRTTTGTSWTTTLAESSRVLDVATFGPGIVMAGGGNGFIWTSSDGGTNWTTRSTGSPRHIQAIRLVSATEAWAAGDGGRVWHTTDFGATWTETTTGTTNTLRGIEQLRDGAILVAGYGGYIGRSIDNGVTWTTIASGTVLDFNRMSIDPIDGRIWLGGDWSATSTDDGRTFVNGQAQTPEFLDIAAAGSNTAYGLTFSSLLKSTNGGATWTNVGSITPTFGAALEVPSPSDVMVTEYGGLHVSHDGAATWTWISGGMTRGEFTSVDAHRVFWGGDGGAIIKVVPAASSIADYSAGSWAAPASSFGVCLQAIGANTAAAWTVDAAGSVGQCEPNDADPWNAVPTSPTAIASTTSFVTTASIDLVWGFKVSSSQLPGTYLAPVEITVVSP